MMRGNRDCFGDEGYSDFLHMGGGIFVESALASIPTEHSEIWGIIARNFLGVGCINDGNASEELNVAKKD